MSTQQPRGASKAGMTIEDKLYLAKYKLDDEPHLKIMSQDVCRKCESKPCMVVCPAEVFEWREDMNIVSYDNCVECGACRIVCIYMNGQKTQNIEWKYPRWGMGLSHRFG